MDKGVLLRFDVPLDRAKARDPASYSVTSWHYQRTYKYGSPQFKADGTPGHRPRRRRARAYLSKDRQSVFVGVPGMKPVMQMQRRLVAGDGRRREAFRENAYLHALRAAAVRSSRGRLRRPHGRSLAARRRRRSAAPVTAEEGGRLSQLYGCIACHATEASTHLAARTDAGRGSMDRSARSANAAPVRCSPTRRTCASRSSSRRRRSCRASRRGRPGCRATPAC